MLNDRIRQAAVLIFAVLDILTSFALGSSLDQGEADTLVYFLPFGLTFAIWGVIFASGLAYAIYQSLPDQRERLLHRRVGPWLALNAALTALWNITAGTAELPAYADSRSLLIWGTVLILLGMLASLTRVIVILRASDGELSGRDRALVQFPVTVFFAWLNVAAIANTAAALAASGFEGGDSGPLWAAAMLAVAAVLASAMILYSRPGPGTLTYSAVIVWAAVGIFFNNIERSTLVAGASIAVAVIVVGVTAAHLANNQRASRLNRPRGAAA
jgi:hypothetical protein